MESEPSSSILECCMNSCVHCVYTMYADDLEEYTSAVDSARKALVAANVPRSQWPREVGSEGGQVKEEETDKVERNVDPTLAAFLA